MVDETDVPATEKADDNDRRGDEGSTSGERSDSRKHSPGDADDDPDRDQGAMFTESRRSVLKAGAFAAGVGGLGLGLSGRAAATKVTETCNGGMIDTNEFRLFDNQWGNPDAQQCVWINDDGSYGWDFDASGTNGGINYPEVFIGTRPWGSDTGVAEFPIRRGDVNEFVLDVEADLDVSGGEWDWAEEWWLMEKKPSVETKTYQYEVMLLLDWGGGHDHGSPVYTDLWTDRFGNTIDLWTVYDSGGTSATFYIFRVQGGHDGGKIDVKRIVDWLTDHEGVREDLWLSGVELGNEYWPEAAGRNTLRTFDVTINGSTYASGSSSGGTDVDSTAPTAPSNLSSPAQTESAVDLTWDPSSDAGGSGLDHYTVSLDGSPSEQVSAGTTSTTVSGLSAGTTYDVSVTAVDGAGNESAASTLSVATDSGDSSDGGSDAIQSGSVYRIANDGSGLSLAVEGGATWDGASLVQHSASSDASQRWRLVDNGDGTYHIENEASGKVADVEGAATWEGANVIQWPWHGGDNQRWRLVDNGDGTYRVENEHSGLVLGVEGSSTADGASAVQQSWSGAASQRWALSLDDGTSDVDSTAPTAPSNLSSPAQTESAVDLTWGPSSDSGGSGLDHYAVSVDGSPSEQVSAGTTSTTVSGLSAGTTYDVSVTAVDGAGNESAASTLSVVTDSGDSSDGGSDTIQSGSVYRIESVHSELNLAVEGGATWDGASLVQHSASSDASQQWRLVDNGDGTYRIENEASGKVADVEGAATWEGANVIQWPWHGGDNQRWRLVDNGDGTYRMENEHSGLVLDVQGVSKSDGANVHQWSWYGGDNQRWRLSLDGD